MLFGNDDADQCSGTGGCQHRGTGQTTEAQIGPFPGQRSAVPFEMFHGLRLFVARRRIGAHNPGSPPDWTFDIRPPVNLLPVNGILIFGVVAREPG
jgi:hypothetical protein